MIESHDSLRELFDVGFVIIRDAINREQLRKLGETYDLMVASARPPDLSIGRTTTRVSNIANYSSDFHQLCVYRPILDACSYVIRQPFKLSTLHARTVRPHSSAQPLHADFEADADGWPMLGFIFMFDDFRTDNGATRFVPGSHCWSSAPQDAEADPVSKDHTELVACGVAGSLILYNGSVWHGHSANRTDELRRSIQGAYIRDC